MLASWRRGQLGLAEVPVMVARGWSDAQKRAYVIASGATPPSTRSTSVATVLSPQSKRWRPSTHKSPGSATGCAG
jgi:hypothetical protein